MVDRSTVIGLVLTVALLAGVMLVGTGLSVHVFWQASSLILVLGGAVLTTVMSSPGARLGPIRGMLRSAFYVEARSVEEVIVTLVALAEIARRQGLLALDRPVAGLRDGFLKRAVHMAIDGYEPGSIRATLQAELESIDLRHRENWSMLESIGRSAPTFGMMGTLIGLVVMLGKMDDPGKIGPGMAVALLTTLYGLVIANVFCLPLARKLSHRNSEELLGKTVAVEGVLAIQAGEHPRVLAHRLEAYLPPGRRSVRVPAPASGREADRVPAPELARSAAASQPGQQSKEAAADRSGHAPDGQKVSSMPPKTAGVSPFKGGHNGRRSLAKAV
jgi:chemotaxis protein MotA